MVKRMDLEGLSEVARQAAVTVAMFYSKKCPVCERQEEDLEALEEELAGAGLRVVKVNVAKGDLVERLKIRQVPTLMLWVRGGVNVGIRFEPGGEIKAKISRRVDGTVLRSKLIPLLREYGRRKP